MKVILEIPKSKILGFAALVNATDEDLKMLMENAPEELEIPRATVMELSGSELNVLDTLLATLAGVAIAEKNAERIKNDLANQETAKK